MYYLLKYSDLKNITKLCSFDLNSPPFFLIKNRFILHYCDGRCFKFDKNLAIKAELWFWMFYHKSVKLTYQISEFIDIKCYLLPCVMHY